MKIRIVTNGRIENLSWLEKKLKEDSAKELVVICADGASNYLKAIDFVPDLLIGDLDSIDPQAKAWMEEKKVPLKKFPSRKDQTDTEIAIGYSVSKKPEEIEVLGAFGSRMDHTLGNVLLLEKFYDPEVSLVLADEQNEMWLINKDTRITGRKNENLSVIPITEKVTELCLRGFEYPLTNHTLYRGNTLGISNIIREEDAEISYKDGKLLGVIAKD